MSTLLASRPNTLSKSALGIILTLVAVISLSGPVAAQQENTKVAFIADQGIGEAARQVLELIRDDGVDLLLIQGDLGYTNDAAEQWINNIDGILGERFPVLIVVGNHEEFQWPVYKQWQIEKLALTPEVECEGDIGVKSFCRYRDIGIVQVAPGIQNVDGVNGDDDYPEYITEKLSTDDSFWHICSWHMTMRDMQTGDKTDESGWPVYQNCLAQGGIVVTGHEHSYSRTHLMSNFEEKEIINTSNLMEIGPNSSFAVVSGLGGFSVRPELRRDDRFASIYTSTQEAAPGALFCNFSGSQAECYMKDIAGRVPDTFMLTSLRAEAVLAAEEAERLRLETEEAERLRLEAEEAERLRLEAEEAERLRLEAEEAERLRLEAEEAERLRLEAEEAERLRLEAEEAERLRLEAEETERRRLEAEEAERLRLEAEEAERLRLEAEEAERLRLEAEEERLRLETEEAERLRLEAEEAERLRLEAEEAERLRLEEERLRLEATEAERIRLQAEAEAAEQARLQAEAEEAERIRLEAEAEAAEQARLQAEAEAAEQARVAAEEAAAEQARLDEEAEEQARIAAEAAAIAEQARLDAEVASAEEEARLEAEAVAAEQARLEAEAIAEQARQEAEAAEAAEQARLVAEAAAQAEAEQARLVAEANAAEQARLEAEAAEQARLAAQAMAQADAAQQALAEAEEQANASDTGSNQADANDANDPNSNSSVPSNDDALTSSATTRVMNENPVLVNGGSLSWFGVFGLLYVWRRRQISPATSY